MVVSSDLLLHLKDFLCCVVGTTKNDLVIPH